MSEGDKVQRDIVWKSLSREKKRALVKFVRMHERDPKPANSRIKFVVSVSDSLWGSNKLTLEEVVMMTARRLAVFDHKMRPKRLRAVKLNLAKRAVKRVCSKTAQRFFRKK
jgi:uncharacterized protein with von Willebrand factor type A (vWA) domain